jgi:hypothetical protein
VTSLYLTEDDLGERHRYRVIAVPYQPESARP